LLALDHETFIKLLQVTDETCVSHSRILYKSFEKRLKNANLNTMAVQTSTLMTAQEYLEFEEKASERHEFVDGIVYEIPGESLENNEIAGNIYTALRPHALARQCRVAIEGVKLWIPVLNRYYYPDVMVLCDDRDTKLKKSKIFENPCFLVEVVSPTPAATDRREKVQAYRMIEALQGYLIVDREEKSLEYYQRDGQTWQMSHHSPLCR
jgi:Uma2 family endonuclease